MITFNYNTVTFSLSFLDLNHDDKRTYNSGNPVFSCPANVDIKLPPSDEGAGNSMYQR